MAATAAKKVGHGGARNTGKKMANNKSGLAGVRFSARLTKSKNPVVRVYVCTAWTDKSVDGKKARRGGYSVRKFGPEDALALAIADRLRAGLPSPSQTDKNNALRKLKEFMKEVKHEDGKGPKDDDDDT